jgi:streptomycin 6-kinase
MHERCGDVSFPLDIDSLASVAYEVARDWDVTLGPPFELSRFSFVVPAGDNAVLKVRSPDDDESDEEGPALEFWNGDGAVRLLREDPARRALLIERARPGTDISELPENDATAIAVDIGDRLWRPANEPFRWIGDHVPRWLDEPEPSDSGGNQESVPYARSLYESLSVDRAVLIHGDFHHHNILDAGDRYVAIDPKPMLGEPEFDVASYLWNPLGHEVERQAIERRLAAFAEIGLSQERMRAWSFIRGVYLGADDETLEVLQDLL